MIVRIMGEGQLEVAETELDRLNELDERLLEAVEQGDTERFRTTLGALLSAVREAGTALPDDVLAPSELILPGGDATVEEVRDLLGDDGLIPG